MLKIIIAGVKETDLIRNLALSIWPIAYKEILTADQLDYMLNLMYSHQALAHQMEHLDHRFIVVYDQDVPIGFAAYSPKISGNPAIYRLHKLYVLTDQQKKGTGKFLLNFILEEIKRLGATSLELNVNRHNDAFQFYTRLGFTVIREEDIDIGNGYFMNDYVMELKF